MSTGNRRRLLYSRSTKAIRADCYKLEVCFCPGMGAYGICVSISDHVLLYT